MGTLAVADPSVDHPAKPVIVMDRSAVGHALADVVTLTDGIGVTEGDALMAAALALTGLTLATPERVLDALADNETLGVDDGDGRALDECDALGVREAADRVEEGEGDGCADVVADALGDDDAAERVDVIDGDTSADDVAEALGDAESPERVDVMDGVGGAEGETDDDSVTVSDVVGAASVGDTEAVASATDADADADATLALAAPVVECEALGEALTSTEGDGSIVPVTTRERDTVYTLDRDMLCDTVTEATKDAESASAREPLAKLETLASRVGDTDCEGLSDGSADTDGEVDSIGDADSEFDALGLDDKGGDADAETEGATDTEDCVDAERVTARGDGVNDVDAECERDTTGVRVAQMVGVPDRVVRIDTEGVIETVLHRVARAEGVLFADADARKDGDMSVDGVTRALALSEGDATADALKLGDALDDGEMDADADTLRDARGVALTESVTTAVDVCGGDAESEGDAVVDELCEGEVESDGDTREDGLVDCDDEADGDAEADELGDIDADVDALALADVESDALSLADVEPDGERVPL